MTLGLGGVVQAAYGPDPRFALRVRPAVQAAWKVAHSYAVLNSLLPLSHPLGRVPWRGVAR